MASGTHLLIDGDILLYQTTAACEQEADWGDGYVTRWNDLKEVESLIADVLHNLFEKFDTESYTICLSDYHKPFRKELCDYYKEQRDGSKKPMGYSQMVSAVERAHPFARFPSLEADDVMGILATDGSREDPVIVSDDKDMQQIPVAVYVPRTKAICYIDKAAGFKFHMKQTLTGDRADNYPGCPGIGEVRADRILDKPEGWDLWGEVVKAYRQARLTEDDALLQARMAKILTAEWWDKEKEQPILWTPSTATTWSTASTADIESAKAQPVIASTVMKYAPTSTTETAPLKSKTTLRSR